MPLAQLTRTEWLNTKFEYMPGDSIGLYGSTGTGKTTFAYQLAGEAMRQNPGMSFTAFQPKPADVTTMAAAERLGLRITPEWPPQRKLFQPKPSGHVHWPSHVTSDADADAEHLAKVFKNSLNSVYWKGNTLAFVDDELLFFGKYKCRSELEQFLIAGRSNHAGLMFALQAPKGSPQSSVSGYHFSQPRWMIWHRENVQSNREKYADVACGIDPHLIMSVVSNLRTYRMGDGNVSEALIIDRTGPYAAIVSPW
jgi:hypothetical protein